MVNLERYLVMSESEILQRLNRENVKSSRIISMSDHEMMAWENLEEPIKENKNDKDYNPFEDEEYEHKNSKEEEEADDEFSETSSSTDYDHLE